jgi:heat shock protein HtpX
MNLAFSDFLRSAILFLLPGLPFLILGYEVGGRCGLTACAITYTFLAVVIHLSAMPMILRQHCARYIPQSQAGGLYGLARELARRAGVPPPELYLMSEASPQLFVAGVGKKSGAVVLSKGLLQVLNRDELAAVMAHAISKIRWGGLIQMTIAAAFVGQLLEGARFFRLSRFVSKCPAAIKRPVLLLEAFTRVLMAPLAAALIRVVAGPGRHFVADERSVHLIGDNDPLREALCKLGAYKAVTPFATASPATAHLFICNPLPCAGRPRFFETHPPLKERIRRLESLWRRPVSLVAFPGVRHASQ